MSDCVEGCNLDCIHLSVGTFILVMTLSKLDMICLISLMHINTRKVKSSISISTSSL